MNFDDVKENEIPKLQSQKFSVVYIVETDWTRS